jgi:hypothetical protein
MAAEDSLTRGACMSPQIRDLGWVDSYTWIYHWSWWGY